MSKILIKITDLVQFVTLSTKPNDPYLISTANELNSIGHNPKYNTGIIGSSFWDMEKSGQPTSAGGEGKTTAEMKTAKTFLDAGWDFVDETENGTEDLWGILEGQGYPRLAWELAE